MFDGMLSPSVLKTMVSKEDYYIGTFNGLSIYDGIIKNYNYENGLPNDQIDIFEDDEDYMDWVPNQRTCQMEEW